MRFSFSERLQAALLVPIIRVVGDVAKMVGYPVGLWWRWQNRATSRDLVAEEWQSGKVIVKRSRRLQAAGQ